MGPQDEHRVAAPSGVDSPLPQPFYGYVAQAAETSALELDLHHGFEVVIALSGAQERRASDLVTTLTPGDVWFCGMLEPHSWRFVSGGGMMVAIEFVAEFIGEGLLDDVAWPTLFTAPPSQRPRIESPRARQTALAIGETLRAEFEGQARGWRSAARAELLRLLLLLARDWAPSARAGDAGAVSPRDLQRVMPAMAHVAAEPGGRLSAAEAASACGLSVAQFNRIFRQVMNMSFHEFILRYRLAAAAKEVLTTDLSLEDIAAGGGFVDHSHLHRVFLRYYGCTPHQYRSLRGLRAQRTVAAP